MPRIPALRNVVQDARAREQQAVPLTPAFDLFLREVLPWWGSAAGAERFDLVFDRLALPTTCHDFIVADRPSKTHTGSEDVLRYPQTDKVTAVDPCKSELR